MTCRKFVRRKAFIKNQIHTEHGKGFKLKFAGLPDSGLCLNQGVERRNNGPTPQDAAASRKTLRSRKYYQRRLDDALIHPTKTRQQPKEVPIFGEPTLAKTGESLSRDIEAGVSCIALTCNRLGPIWKFLLSPRGLNTGELTHLPIRNEDS